MSFLTKIFGDANERYLKRIEPIVKKINELEPKFGSFSDEELKQKTQEFKERLKNGETLDDILIEGFALVREASKRTLNQRHFDVQIIGGIAMHQGKIVQMLTGEGKTLAATLPAYLNALSGNGVHIITVNDYLARRDAVWMSQIYYLLGLSVSCLNHEQAFLYDPDYKRPDEEKDKVRDELGGFKIVEDYLRPCSRKQVYEADITYGTNNEFGFDYLRDNMVRSQADLVQRPLNFAILDEIDFILIDESRTPLIISAPDAKAAVLYKSFAKIIPQLNSEQDYEIDEKLKIVNLTEQGIKKIEKILGVENIYAEGGIDYLHHLEQALRAHVLFKKDVDYVVRQSQIIIVDEFTGRLMPGRRWSSGLHQAIEAKEGMEIQPESRTLATITFQNYFRLYQKLAGMTGTAVTSAEEFDKVYGLEVISIPTNKPMIRKNLTDRVYLTKKGKLQAIVKEIKQRHQQGQPILIGTRSIEKNEILSLLLKRQGLAHQVLNAKNHEKEAEIIAQAGRLGTITVATNMAGRGVDIILGGNPFDQNKAKKIIELDGLHVIGTERHEARRIDNQLRGRAGRQGDPGSSQFFLSLEDELLRVFGGERMEKIKSMLAKAQFPETEPIESNLVSKAIEQAQAKIEGMYFDVRKNLLDYDNVMNKHREAFYKKRREVLERPDVQQQKALGLQIMDFYWMQHLEDMQWLRDSVKLQAFDKSNPLVVYKTQGYEIFQEMMIEIDHRIADIVSQIVEQSPKKTEQLGYAISKSPEPQPRHRMSGLGEARPRENQINQPRKLIKVGRNDSCPCGAVHHNGRPKKYKHCCGKLVTE